MSSPLKSTVPLGIRGGWGWGDINGPRDHQGPCCGDSSPQILKGFRDYLPEQMLLRQEVMGRIRRVFESHGFEPLDTPVLEYMEILTGKAGENEKLAVCRPLEARQALNDGNSASAPTAGGKRG